jgi:RimJ/RimL family protein N-acetyltransferase
MRLITERLTLDLHGLDDFGPLAEMWSDVDTVRFLGGKTSSWQDSWMRLLRYRGLWPLLGYGYWAIRESATGRFVGELGFADFHRPTEPSFEGVPEAGWVLASWAHGKGYATEALSAALSWLDGAGWARSVCIIDPANTPSLRLAEKVGYGNPSTIRFGNEPITLYERLARP